MLDLREVKSSLKQAQIPLAVEYYPVLPSTNDQAWKIHKAGTDRDTLIVTDHQTAGRGRGAHAWQSQAETSLTFSILRRSGLSANLAGLLPIITGIAVVETLLVFDISAKLKWPNDIYLNGKKVGGILCESTISAQTITTAVIGIGLNVNNLISDFSPNLRSTVTTLRQVAKQKFKREKILTTSTSILYQYLNQLNTLAPEIPARWRRYGIFLNSAVTMHTSESDIIGKFMGINERGEALLNIAGKIGAFASGEIHEFREI
ncbi:MAG: biotin--[acetyl-CoA-carboxylase] ligase [Candidatus Marinimicrobia bacterium]|nr:biotin--[acetyl-CoA-carboxylase] ligase [Candidatus Neomarinimicrobiota bacterium]